MEWREQKPQSVWTLESLIPDLRTTATRAYVEAYLAMREEKGDGVLPSKSGLDMRRMARAIPYLSLVAVTISGPCVYRLVGEAVQERVGFNPVGRNYYDFVPAERLPAAIRGMEMVVRVPSGFRAWVRQMYDDGATRMMEAIGLPLSDREPGVDGFILFAEQALSETATYLPPGNRWSGADILRRDLIDLGFGVDRDFVDLVRAG